MLHRALQRTLVLFRDKNLVRTLSTIAKEETLSEEELFPQFTAENGLPRIQGRPYLPGAWGTNMPTHIQGPSDEFPLVIDAAGNFAENAFTEMSAFVKSKLQQHMPSSDGAMLFKGLPLKSAADFASLNAGLGYRTMSYDGGTAVRERLDAGVMTASHDPAAYTIEPHNEFSYVETHWPSYVAFFCEVPPEPKCGGESVIVRNRKFQVDIDPEVKDKFNRLGVRYAYYMPGKKGAYLSWQEVFDSEDKSEVEKKLTAMGSGFKWHDDTDLWYFSPCTATKRHHVTGEDIWFNQVHCDASYFRSHPLWCHLKDVPDDRLPFTTYYGDGSTIEPEVIQHLRDTMWKHATGIQLQKGEVLFMDNMLVQHGRLGYVGKRRLLVTLTDDVL